MEQESSIGKNKISVLTILISLMIVSGYLNTAQFGGGLSTQIIFVVLFFASLGIFYPKRPIRITIESILILCYWFIQTLSTIFSDLVIVRSDTFTFLISSVLFLIITGLRFNSQEIKFLIHSFIFVAVVASLNIIFNYFTSNYYTFIFNRYSTDFFGFEKDPNYVAAYLIPAGLLIFYKLMNFNNKKRVKLVILFLIINFAIILTNSRAGFVVMLVAYAYVIIIKFFERDFSTRQKLTYISIFLIILIIFVSNITNILSLDLFSRLTDVSSYRGNVRLDMWSSALGLLKDKPLFGVGYGGAHANSLALFNIPSAHNSFVDLVTNAGIVGSLIFLCVFILLLRGKPQDRKYLLGLLFTFFAPTFFNSMFNTTNFWIPLWIMGILKNYSIDTDKELIDWF